MKWIQRPPGTQFPSSPATDYHGCLDALIATIVDMRMTRLSYQLVYENDGAPASSLARFLTEDIVRAQERAAICAGMLFDRWIEETPSECAGCRSCITATGVKDERLARLHYAPFQLKCPPADPSQIF